MDRNDKNRSYVWIYDRCTKLLARQRMSRARNEMLNKKGRAYAATKGLCADWVKRGKCDNKAECAWDHPESCRGRPAAAAGERSSAGGNSPKFCTEFARTGKCTKSNCPAKNHKPPCSFHLKGKCNKGKACDYPHVKPSAPAVRDSSNGRRSQSGGSRNSARSKSSGRSKGSKGSRDSKGNRKPRSGQRSTSPGNRRASGSRSPGGTKKRSGSGGSKGSGRSSSRTPNGSKKPKKGGRKSTPPHGKSRARSSRSPGKNRGKSGKKNKSNSPGRGNARVCIPLRPTRTARERSSSPLAREPAVLATAARRVGEALSKAGQVAEFAEGRPSAKQRPEVLRGVC